MDWQHPYISTAEVVFNNWLRQIHGHAFAAEYHRGDDPDYKHRNDPDYYPQCMTKNDQPLHRR